MFPECSCMCACVSVELTFLVRYVGYLLTELDQTFTTNGLLDKDEHVKFFVSKGQGSRSRWDQICSKMLFQPCNCHMMAEA